MLDKGYGIMPNVVLFDKDISATSKLVYVLVSSLCAEKGYCWANNAYIGKQLNLSERQVSRSIKQLSKYLQIDNPYNERRQICLDKNVAPVRQKRLGSLDKNVAHNITKKNISIKGNSSEEYFNRFFPNRAHMMPDITGDRYKKDAPR